MKSVIKLQHACLSTLPIFYAWFIFLSTTFILYLYEPISACVTANKQLADIVGHININTSKYEYTSLRALYVRRACVLEINTHFGICTFCAAFKCGSRFCDNTLSLKSHLSHSILTAIQLTHTHRIKHGIFGTRRIYIIDYT